MASSDSDSDSGDEEFLFWSALALDFERRRRGRRRRARPRWWVRPWIANRQEHGAYHALRRELEENDVGAYTNFLRMAPEQFDQLLTAVSPLIERQNTLMRESISAGERLAVTLRFLATGM